jgi:hypothetical protein
MAIGIVFQVLRSKTKPVFDLMSASLVLDIAFQRMRFCIRGIKIQYLLNFL